MSMDQFFQQIVYSAANEDPASERRALRLGPDDVVLCITGSGARPLDLLIDGPKRLVSIDFNARQNHLLELKMACIRSLDHSGMLAFLGVYPHVARQEVYREQLRDQLSGDARRYWDAHSDAISSGVLYCGVWESYMAKVKGWLGPRGPLLHQLVTAETLEEQQALWKKWNTWYWRAFMGVLNWRWIWRTVLNEPGIDFVPDSVRIDQFLIRAFERAATEQPLWSNPYYNLMVGDGYHEGCLPLHLQAEHFETLRANLDRLEVVQAPLVAHLQDNPDTYTAFSVSDFSSYADPVGYRQVWEALIAAAKPGAKVCERFFLVKYQPHTLFPDHIVRDRAIEAENEATDHTFIYSFNCCEIRK